MVQLKTFSLTPSLKIFIPRSTRRVVSIIFSVRSLIIERMTQLCRKTSRGSSTGLVALGARRRRAGIVWSNGIPLKDLKQTHPVEVAEYATANKISEEPAFAWWVCDVLQKRNHIISKVASRYWKTTHKFGIEVPKSVKHALEIDKRNGNRFWKNGHQERDEQDSGHGNFRTLG